MQKNHRKESATVVLVIGVAILVFALFLSGIFGIVGVVMKRLVTSTERELAEFQKQGAKETNGVVLGTIHLSDDDEATRIKYYVSEEDTWYECQYPLVSSDYLEGTEIVIYYNPEDPTDIRFPDLYISTYNLYTLVASWIAGILGGIFSFGGIVIIIIGVVLRKTANKQ